LYQETSREAWRSFIPHSAQLDTQIMEAVEAAGAGGIMCQEIEAASGRSHQAVSANLSRLAARGFVVPTGSFGKTSSGRKAIKWMVANV
jgi:predicted transcriptional regulator